MGKCLTFEDDMRREISEKVELKFIKDKKPFFSLNSTKTMNVIAKAILEQYTYPAYISCHGNYDEENKRRLKCN